MNRKAISFLMCLLMIATAVPTVTSIKNSTINTMVPILQNIRLATDRTETPRLLTSESETATVVSKRTNLTFFITGGLGVSLKIANTGTTSANDVPWQIHVEGGIFGKIEKTVNGTIDIPLGELITIVETGLFFGLGRISITGKVADEEQKATGKQFIVFSIVK